MSSLDFSLGGVSPYGGSGYPNSGYQFDWGGVLDPIGDAATQAVGDVVQGAISSLSDAISSKFSDPSGQTQVIGVQPGNVMGLGALLSYMESNPPPADSASRADKGNYVRYASTAVLGIPHDVVWMDETSKRQTYELFRAYLGVFDDVTGGKYGFKATIPPSQPPKYSDNDQARPYTLYTKLRNIGAAGLKAIDTTWNGQTLDASTTEYIAQTTQTDAGGNALTDALKSILHNLLTAGQTVLESAATGAAGGAQVTSAGAATGAKASQTAFFGGLLSSPVLLLGGVVLVIYLLKRK